jgi:short-subunit dehydrogenase
MTIRNQPRVAIITGASSGIGAACAYELARRGYAVALAARREDRLRQVADQCSRLGSPQAIVVPTDVAQESQVQALVDGVAGRLGRLDVMINNAGYGLFARVDETTTEQMRQIFEVNYFGVFWGARAAAAVMVRQGFGHIFNVSSVLGKRGSPYHGAYSATKFAIMGLSDAMRVELRCRGVKVTAVCPALTETEFFELSDRARAAGSSFTEFKGKTPARVVARRMAGAIGHGKPEIVFTFGGKLLALLAALSPRLVDRMMLLYHRDLARRLDERP